MPMDCYSSYIVMGDMLNTAGRYCDSYTSNQIAVQNKGYTDLIKIDKINMDTPWILIKRSVIFLVYLLADKEIYARFVR